MDDDQRQQRQEEAEAQVVKTHEGIAGPQDAVAVAVKVLAVLLQHRLVPVARGPAVIRSAIGLVVRGSDVCACEAWR